MPNVIEGQLVASGLRFGVVVSRFNTFITGRLLDGALDALQRHGADPATVDVVWVPGTFEVPIVTQQLASSGRYHAVICLGCLIRGGTPHFDYLSAEVTKGVAQVGLSTGVPAVFGVLTTDTIEQAIERAGTKAGNKGFDAAVTAIEMADVVRRLGEHVQNAPRVSGVRS
jgi:6,7-dimethyl-8-ribityllumazine synthase